MEFDKTLVEAIKDAAKKAFTDLFEKHSEEHFYYCTLVLMEDGCCPIVSAMSEEVLETMVQENEDPPEIAREMLKWSYADSPYCAYGEQYFTEVEKLMVDRDVYKTEEMYETEYDLRLNSMEKAMAELDKEGIFGSREGRKNMVVLTEIMPPDYTNTERALRLNPRETLKEWLEEAAEEIYIL